LVLGVTVLFERVLPFSVGVVTVEFTLPLLLTVPLVFDELRLAPFEGSVTVVVPRTTLLLPEAFADKPRPLLTVTP